MKVNDIISTVWCIVAVYYTKTNNDFSTSRKRVVVRWYFVNNESSMSIKILGGSLNLFFFFLERRVEIFLAYTMSIFDSSKSNLQNF